MAADTDSAPEINEHDIHPVPVVIVKSDEGPGEVNRLRLNSYNVPSDLSTFQLAAHNATRQSLEVRYDKSGTGIIWISANRNTGANLTSQAFRLNPGESLVFTGTHNVWCYGTVSTATDIVSVKEESTDG